VSAIAWCTIRTQQVHPNRAIRQMLFRASFRFCLQTTNVYKRILQTTNVNYGQPSRNIFRKSAISVRQHKLARPGRASNCVTRVQSTLFSDEKERDLLDKRVIFVRDVPAKTPNIKGKIRTYFSSFGEVENVRRIEQGMLFVSFKSVESAHKALKTKHFFEGQWITVLPNVVKGIWKEKSCKIKVDEVPQSMSEKELTSYFSKFGTVTNVDFIILDPDTLERKKFCFIEFSSLNEAKKVANVQEHKVGVNCLKVSLSTSKLSAVKSTKEIIVRSLPHDITVNDLKEYFKQFGALEQIDLICQTLARPHTTYAFVTFQSPYAAEQASESLIHRICGKKTVVQKSALSYRIKNGDRKLFVEGFQPNTDPEQVRKYFEEFGKLEHIKKTAIRPTGKTYIVFKSKASVQHVLRLKEHVLDGCHLRIRPVSWRKPDFLTTLIEMAELNEKTKSDMESRTNRQEELQR